MSANQAEFRIVRICLAQRASRSGYYSGFRRLPGPRAQEDSALSARVRGIHEISDGIYGAPRVHAEFRPAGCRLGRNRGTQLMRQSGLSGVMRRCQSKSRSGAANEPVSAVSLRCIEPVFTNTTGEAHEKQGASAPAFKFRVAFEAVKRVQTMTELSSRLKFRHPRFSSGRSSGWRRVRWLSNMWWLIADGFISGFGRVGSRQNGVFNPSQGAIRHNTGWYADHIGSCPFERRD